MSDYRMSFGAVEIPDSFERQILVRMIAAREPIAQVLVDLFDQAVLLDRGGSFRLRVVDRFTDDDLRLAEVRDEFRLRLLEDVEEARRSESARLSNLMREVPYGA